MKIVPQSEFGAIGMAPAALTFALVLLQPTEGDDGWGDPRP